MEPLVRQASVSGCPIRLAAKAQSIRDEEPTMQQELRIAFRNMDVSEALERRIRTRVSELEQICDRITACDVVVELIHRKPQPGKLFHVRLDLALPGRTIVVKRDPDGQHAHEDAHAAVRDAFNVARQQLADHVRVMRGNVKAHAQSTMAE
jgi:ribosome-associated translation inhibitor RaiA